MKNALRTHTLKGTALDTLFRRAMRQGKEPVYIVYFEEAGITAEIRLSRG